jgi:signal transduction histidine kinase
MKRLYVQIFLTVAAAIVLFAVLAGIAWRYLGEPRFAAAGREAIADLVYAALPPADAPREEQRAALERLAGRVPRDIGLFDATGGAIAQIGRRLPPPNIRRADGGWVGRRGAPALSIPLPDGRWVVTRFRRPPHSPLPGLAMTLGLLALGVAVGAFPVVRRLTRRLERLKAGVEALGSGDLATRVKVEGRDEVAALATSFNRSAERIETLVRANRDLLANASHELRSPLARLKVAVAMLETEAKPETRAEIERDIGELDALIDEILLASRLDAGAAEEPVERIDLLGLAAEEAARAESAAALPGTPATAIGVEGASVEVNGAPRLLRRMLRNLIENALRHGGSSPVTVRVARVADRAEISVCDCGPGVPEAERERVFEPFYRTPGTREREGGVGLGLALVRAIARRHGGDARCLPREGGGTCFVVDIAPWVR